MAFGAGDTAYVYDIRLRRYSVWSPDLQFLRSFNGPAPDFAAVITDDGRLVIAGSVPTRDAIGWPLHILDPVSGAVLKSLGSNQLSQLLGMEELNRRRIAAARAGGVWAAHLTAYRIERWDLEGRRMIEIAQDVDWFKPHDGRLPADGVPGSYINAIHEDRDGLIWVFIQVPDRNHAANRARLPRDHMGTIAGAMDVHGLLDTIIEVIDPRTGTLITARRFDQHLTVMGNGSPLYAYREGADGNPKYDVFQARLVR